MTYVEQTSTLYVLHSGSSSSSPPVNDTVLAVSPLASSPTFTTVFTASSAEAVQGIGSTYSSSGGTTLYISSSTQPAVYSLVADGVQPITTQPTAVYSRGEGTNVVTLVVDPLSSALYYVVYDYSDYSSTSGSLYALALQANSDGQLVAAAFAQPELSFTVPSSLPYYETAGLLLANDRSTAYITIANTSSGGTVPGGLYSVPLSAPTGQSSSSSSTASHSSVSSSTHAPSVSASLSSSASGAVTAGPPSSSSPSSSSLSGGAIAGIVVGGVAAAVLLVVGVVVLCRLESSFRDSKPASQPTSPAVKQSAVPIPANDLVTDKREVDSSRTEPQHVDEPVESAAYDVEMQPVARAVTEV